jgi:hypothetical protein
MLAEFVSFKYKTNKEMLWMEVHVPLDYEISDQWFTEEAIISFDGNEYTEYTDTLRDNFEKYKTIQRLKCDSD